MLACVFFVVVLGIASVILAKREQKPWVDKDPWAKVAKAHKLIGVILIILSQVTCLTGLVQYVNEKT